MVSACILHVSRLCQLAGWGSSPCKEQQQNHLRIITILVSKTHSLSRPIFQAVICREPLWAFWGH